MDHKPPKPVSPMSTIRPIRIGCPLSGSPGAPDIFDGTAAGTYSPPVTDLSTLRITVNFSSAQGGINYTVNATPDTTGGWSATFPAAQLPTSPVTDGVLKATKNFGGANTDSAPSDNLAWTPPSHEEAHVLKLTITQPVPSDVVGRVFLVYGDYAPGHPGHEHTVTLELIRETGDTALAAFLPPVYPSSHKWVTTVQVLEGGLHYTLKATLRKKTGEAIISYPVGNITILG